MSRKPIIRELEEYHRPIGGKTWKRGEPEQKLKEVMQGVFDLVKRRKPWLEYLGSEYEKTKNPLFPWDARSLAREWRLPVPEWVETYLDQAGKKLLWAENRNDILGRALGFSGNKGRNSVFEQYRNCRAKDYGASQMQNYINQGASAQEALKQATQDVTLAYGPGITPRMIKDQRKNRKK